MVARLQQLNRLHVTLLLAGMSLFSFGLSVARFFLTDTKLFLFLNWNLFLAFIPWAISTFIILTGSDRKILLALLLGTWILFFPNSPYILTDLAHLKYRSSTTIWYDLIMILSYAWTGLLFGFVSLMDIENLLTRYFNKRIITVTTILFLFLGAFGVYLGRFLRWNSWDVVSDPSGLFYDILVRFTYPHQHLRTWAITILIGILLNMMYFSLKLIRERKI